MQLRLRYRMLVDRHRYFRSSVAPATIFSQRKPMNTPIIGHHLPVW